MFCPCSSSESKTSKIQENTRIQTHKTTRGGTTRYHQTVTLLVISPPNQKDTKRLGSNCCFIKLPEVGKRHVCTNQIVKQVKRWKYPTKHKVFVYHRCFDRLNSEPSRISTQNSPHLRGCLLHLF